MECQWRYAERLVYTKKETNRPSEPARPSTIPGPDGSSLACQTQDWQQTGKLETDSLITLDTAPAIFPGALVQGKDLLKGQLTQIKGIPRAGGTLYLTNLILKGDSNPTTTKDPLYTRQVATIDGATVNEAIHNILTQQSLGTAAQFSYSEEAGYSSEQIKYAMGISADFPSGAFAATLDVATDNQKSYTYLMFTQVYYDVVFDSWTGPVSLFRDGEAFQDPNQEVTPGNPPLYVEKVSYGRQVL